MTKLMKKKLVSLFVCLIIQSVSPEKWAHTEKHWETPVYPMILSTVSLKDFDTPP